MSPDTAVSASRHGDALVLAEHGAQWLACRAPEAVLKATSAADVTPLLREVEARTRAGRSFAVGFVAYEAGAAYGLATHPLAPLGLPLAAFALYPPDSVREVTSPAAATAFAVRDARPSVDVVAYRQSFARVKRHILDGDTYQVNGTFALEAAFEGDPRQLFSNLVHTQRGRYAAWLRLGRHHICSASPELFFARTGTRLVARPMKGSAPRGLWADDDRRAALRLRSSSKERAENVMVVDMVRNDLGRVARVGSVRARRLFALERYPTIWQMTSEIVADGDAPLDALFEAMFPSASITGAPKARTMEIIRDSEPSPRGVYTGAVGYVAPGGDAQFNVAIRTALVDELAGRLSFGVGSGIVWDSDADEEYRECLLKGRVLERRHEPFDLLETLAWSPEAGYALLDEHLDRLSRSAAYFGVPVRPARVRRALEDAVADARDAQRVRLLVEPGGRPRIEASALAASTPTVRACLAREPIDPSDRFYYHKTTRRSEYERRRCARCEDVVLWNGAGEITESLACNVVVEQDGAMVTPPVSAGLLGGTRRAALLGDGRIVEAPVRVEALRRATRAWLVNSVRGWRSLELVRHEAGAD